MSFCCFTSKASRHYRRHGYCPVRPPTQPVKDYGANGCRVSLPDCDDKHTGKEKGNIPVQPTNMYKGSRRLRYSKCVRSLQNRNEPITAKVLQKTSNVRIKATLRRVRVSIFAAEKQ